MNRRRIAFLLIEGMVIGSFLIVIFCMRFHNSGENVCQYAVFTGIIGVGGLLLWSTIFLRSEPRFTRIAIITVCSVVAAILLPNFIFAPSGLRSPEKLDKTTETLVLPGGEVLTNESYRINVRLGNLGGTRINRFYFADKDSRAKEFLGFVDERDAQEIKLSTANARVIRQRDRIAVVIDKHLFTRPFDISEPDWWDQLSLADEETFMFLRSFLVAGDSRVYGKLPENWRPSLLKVPYRFDQIDLVSGVVTARRDSDESNFPEVLIYHGDRLDLLTTRAENHLPLPPDPGLVCEVSGILLPDKAVVSDCDRDGMLKIGGHQVLHETFALSFEQWQTIPWPAALWRGSSKDEHQLMFRIGFIDPIPDWISVYTRIENARLPRDTPGFGMRHSIRLGQWEPLTGSGEKKQILFRVRKHSDL